MFSIWLNFCFVTFFLIFIEMAIIHGDLPDKEASIGIVFIGVSSTVMGTILFFLFRLLVGM